jgi:DNA-binding transcriptional LysR family regulator
MVARQHLAAVSGPGITSTSLWGCRAEIAAGTLVPILADWKIESIELHAVFTAGRAVKLSARAFADHLVKALRESPATPQAARAADLDARLAARKQPLENCIC